METSFLPPLFGGDINVYSMARAFHEAYVIRSAAYGKFATGVCYESAILDYRVCAQNEDWPTFFQNVCGYAGEHPDKTVLVIGCGAGHVLPPLWQSGFDLSACETSPALREQARRRAPQGVEIEAASPDWLPFADNSFDWVLLRADELPPAALPAALGEACRVAACGLALTFWNSASLPWLTWRLHGRRHAWPGHCLPFWTAWRLLAARPGRLHAASCLWRPACRWHPGTHVHAAALSRLPFGAWCVLRLDMSPRRTGTPLPLRLRPRLDTARPVMEYDSLRTTGQPPAQKQHP